MNCSKKTSVETMKEESIVTLLKSAAELTLPKLSKNMQPKEIWKEDKILNELINERLATSKDSLQHKNITKCIKKRVRHLCNKKTNNETKVINSFATRRQV